MEQILFHGMEIQLERRKVKNLNVYVKPPEGQVLVTIPMRMPQKRVMEFLETKLEWIEIAREKVRERNRGRASVPQEFSEEEKVELKKKILEYAAKWEPLLHVHATRWQVRLMKTRWGSCSVESGNMRINLALTAKPEECLEYVVLHELCHLREPNHGAGFHALLDQHMPDWRERKRKLENTGTGE